MPRLYVGNILADVRKEDVEAHFSRIGQVDRVDMKGSYCFVEYESQAVAEIALRELNNSELKGGTILVQEAKPPRRVAAPQQQMQRSDFRIRVEGISSTSTWQDLKDFGRGTSRLSPLFTQIVRPGIGIVEYHTHEDMRTALRQLHNTELRGVVVQVYEVCVYMCNS